MGAKHSRTDFSKFVYMDFLLAEAVEFAERNKEVQMQRKELRLIGSKALAKSLGLSETWVRAAAAARQIPFYQCGGQRMFDLDEILAFLRREVATEGTQAQPESLQVT